MPSLLAWLCSAELPAAPQTLAEWWAVSRPVRELFPRPIERAAASGLFADRVGWAFASGYQAALGAMFPALGTHDLAALCATEATGARPRDIHTTLAPHGDGLALTGTKQWTTVAPFAGTLFVVATTGTGPDGRPQLKVVRVSSAAAGVAIRPMQDLPFVPEIPHAGVGFARVAVPGADVLEGDGYTRYLKPFRTVEDLHVNAALLGYVLGVARRCEWPRPAKEQLLAHVASCVALATLPVAAAETHLALAGLLTLVSRTLEECSPLFERLGADERARWERDRPLFHVAERARAARLEKAWEQFP